MIATRECPPPVPHPFSRPAFQDDGQRSSPPLASPNGKEEQPLLTILVPVYNEAATIDELLRRVLAASGRSGDTTRGPRALGPPYGCPTFQIVVVDDGSTDATREKLEPWQTHATVLSHAENRGKGAAIRTGLANARGRFTIIQDADLEYDPRDYERLIAPLLAGQADVVYGSRYLTSSGNSTEGNEGNETRTSISRSEMTTLPSLPSRPFVQLNRWSLCRFGVWLLNRLVDWLYGLRITDEATCYKVFRTADLRAMDLQCEGFEFCPEVTAKACRMGLRIVELPIRYTPRTVAEGKKIRWRDGLSAIRTLWRWRVWQPLDRATHQRLGNRGDGASAGVDQ